MKNFNISVILPIKSALVKDFDEYLVNAVSSVLKQKKEINELVIVHTAEENLVEALKSFDFSGITVNLLQYNGEPNFCSQVNYGVENCNSEWFSILEFDDEYSPIWFDNVGKYLNHFDNVLQDLQTKQHLHLVLLQKLVYWTTKFYTHIKIFKLLVWL